MRRIEVFFDPRQPFGDRKGCWCARVLQHNGESTGYQESGENEEEAVLHLLRRLRDSKEPSHLKDYTLVCYRHRIVPFTITAQERELFENYLRGKL